MRFQSLSIRAKLLCLTLGLLIPLILAGFFNLWNFWQASRTQLDESLKRQAELAATAFEQRILAYRQTLEMIVVLAGNNESRLALQDYLDSIVKTRPNWLDIQIVNADGETVLSQSNKNLNLQAVPIKELKDEAARENSFVISTEQTAGENPRLLSLALPIANGNFVVARISGASVSEVFENLKLPEDNIIAVFDKNNRLLYRSRVSPEQMSLDTSETPLFAALKEKREGVIEVESPYDKIRRVYGLARIEATNSVVIVGVPSAKLYEPAREQFIRQMLFGLLVAVLAVAAAYWMARSITRPMRLLTGAARSFGAGDLTTRTEVTGGGTIGELGTTFNQMAEEITQREEELKALDRLKSEFVSSVSHELRTPLTTIKTLTRVLQSNKISKDEREVFLETIAVECDRQIDFVQTLLDLSRIESGAYKISLSETDVAKILRESIEAQRRAADSRKLNLEFTVPPDDLLLALTDAGALRRIVSSLIENSMKYTPEGGQVAVSVGKQDELIAVE
ncbi:MAG TPA: histidine kinase dimerization/phospho-acceptor domain-containing protein, partial [Pyrinomonadaceae bacterium]|nr:histidine kinase dimerization/phospho-acceptor domain-containing protein [Pyrinomonadaceae bacterium]